MGISIPPRLRIRTCEPSSLAVTDSIAWSSRELLYSQPRQNQSRSIPAPSSIIRKKSAGDGCLKVHAATYSRKARSNRSAPMTSVRSR